MITKNEISSLNLSPTKKDFVQIWNELIEVASKITERWDPTSTNESDPGIVLLKVLAGIADKLNYNIDKNILEAYMPTAAQMESMRKLCELVGYDIKYYQSAETKVRISYTGNTTDDDNDEKLPEPSGLALPKFTTITNANKDITFVTTNTVPVYLTNAIPWVEVPCIEGQISQCESINEYNLITLSQLDDKNRYYLPEIQIAENGIFVYSATMTSNAEYIDDIPWEQVSNLNTSPTETRVFKFGYDSLEGRPYLAFPDDIGSLIGDGLFIYFIRTSGLNGNISPRTLEVLEVPTGDDWENYSAEQFDVVNTDATTNGADIESISAAYNNFKKTVGTFDTLVTCRDYMNKIYSLMDANNSPYVSNILVTDIRNDINNAITLCSCNEFGILYKETSRTKTVEATSTTKTAKSEVMSAIDDNGNQINKLVITNDFAIVETELPLIDHFDLLLYPFKTFTQVSSGTKDLVTPYNKSFTYTEQLNREIDASLADLKTCAHNLTTPKEGDIVAINNYLRLDALIATSTKVSEIEADNILQNIKVALVNEFNLRNLDFGEEIPFDSILSVIEKADSRIKAVSLQEPTVLTTYSIKVKTDTGATSKEYGIASTVTKPIANVVYEDIKETAGVVESSIAKDIYNKLVIRNILAGRASLFDYDETFIPSNSERPYTITKNITEKLATAQADDSRAVAIKSAISEIMGSSAILEAGEYLLYNDTGDPIKTGFHSLNSVLTLNVFETERTTESGDIVATFDYKLYETYEPSFRNTDSSTTAPATVSQSDSMENTEVSAENIHSSNIIKDITRVEAICEIKGDDEGYFENITLGKNEVIKFRAPNLITTKTFPAYVYYHFERAAQSGNGASGNISDDGSYATAVSLKSFISSVGTETFFTKLWLDNSSKLLTFKWKKSDGTELDQSSQLPSILNSAIVVYTDDGAYEEVTEGTAGAIEYNEKYYTYKSGKTLCVNRSSIDLYIGLTAARGKTEATFKYYPLNTGTMTDWGNCVKAFETLPGDTVFWRLSQTSSFPKGRLVTEYGQKLYAQTGDYLMNNSVGDITYICKNLGSDPVFYSIPKDSDIELRSGDKLYIHYTPSSTNEDGETANAEPISIVYSGDDEDPVILKPSFELIPSIDVNKQGTSWKKTEVDFGTPHGKQNLLALGANEQIELRSISKVVLSKPARFYKNFDNSLLEQGNINTAINYELKDGEYIFYTDQNAQGAAYYGSGSVITLSPGAYIPKASEKIEVSQILEQGLHTVPWSNTVLLTDERTVTIAEYQYVTLVEGDTLNGLVIDSESTNKTLNNAEWLKCDPSYSISYTPAGAENRTKLPKIRLSSKATSSKATSSWEACSLLELSTSPGHAQQLRATEAVTNKVNVYVDNGTGESLDYIIKPELTELADTTASFEPVSIKLSTIAKSATGNLENITKTDNTSIQLKVFKEELPSTIELTDHADIITPISNKHSVSTRIGTVNINDHLTKIDINNELWRESTETRIDENGESVKVFKPNAFKLNFMIPKDNDLFGIFSIYLDVPMDKLDEASKQNIPIKQSRVFIDIPREFGSDVISIFNYKKNSNDTEFSWWADGSDTTTNRFYLRAGLNCIKVARSCSLYLKAEENAAGSILYDDLRLVKGINTHGVNLKLLDPNATFNVETVAKEKTDKEKADKEKADLASLILNNINELDKKHEFYYNVPIENGLAIEFDNNINSFSNPYTLYDINNINNSFVVSKLDVAYLDEGLRIAKSSRY